jgi:hypothetical protein
MWDAQPRRPRAPVPDRNRTGKPQPKAWDRDQYVRELRRLGLRKKAVRAEGCCRYGSRKVCIGNFHQFYSRRGCKVTTCPPCARFYAERVTARYVGRFQTITSKIRDGCAAKGRKCVEAAMEFGREFDHDPTSKDLRQFVAVVRRYWAARRATEGLSKSCFAAVMSADVDGRTVRVRAFYVGPRLEDQANLWRKVAEAGDQFSMSGARVPRLAIVQLFRPLDRSPVEAARAELALDGVRRVWAIGALYGAADQKAKPVQPELCPYCASELLPVLGRLQPVERLERDGYRELVVVRQEVAAARAAPPGLAA